MSERDTLAAHYPRADGPIGSVLCACGGYQYDGWSFPEHGLPPDFWQHATPAPAPVSERDALRAIIDRVLPESRDPANDEEVCISGYDFWAIRHALAAIPENGAGSRLVTGADLMRGVKRRDTLATLLAEELNKLDEPMLDADDVEDLADRLIARGVMAPSVDQPVTARALVPEQQPTVDRWAEQGLIHTTPALGLSPHGPLPRFGTNYIDCRCGWNAPRPGVIVWWMAHIEPLAIP